MSNEQGKGHATLLHSSGANVSQQGPPNEHANAGWNGLTNSQSVKNTNTINANDRNDVNDTTKRNVYYATNQAHNMHDSFLHKPNTYQNSKISTQLTIQMPDISRNDAKHVRKVHHGEPQTPKNNSTIQAYGWGDAISNTTSTKNTTRITIKMKNTSQSSVLGVSGVSKSVMSDGIDNIRNNCDGSEYDSDKENGYPDHAQTYQNYGPKIPLKQVNLKENFYPRPKGGGRGYGYDHVYRQTDGDKCEKTKKLNLSNYHTVNYAKYQTLPNDVTYENTSQRNFRNTKNTSHATSLTKRSRVAIGGRVPRTILGLKYDVQSANNHSYSWGQRIESINAGTIAN